VLVKKGLMARRAKGEGSAAQHLGVDWRCNNTSNSAGIVTSESPAGRWISVEDDKMATI